MAIEPTAREYLEEMLSFDPLAQAEQLVARRERWRGRDPAERSLLRDGPDRDEVRNTLEGIRGDLEDGGRVEPNRLSTIDVDRFPDLARLAHRLGVMNRHVDFFESLTERFPHAEGLIDFLRRALLAPTSHAMEMRRGLDADFRSGANRIEGAKHVVKVVRLIRTEAPEVFGLEREWFEALNKFKQQRRMSKQVKHGWIWIILVWFLFRWIMKLFD